ncbi:hypothetical protein [Marinisporobacter balticus]|uniref:Uncharacterized protein n=1 Tax=Marinisporobacter balticus TaxID=2018667 RepID=A0A4R2KTK3_9FIRM|nr:hypothetical protein [Marinisporobacter balticus]TCO74426.1 hypothetical protein EV214_11372 [Marinisporobacter balticus]
MDIIRFKEECTALQEITANNIDRAEKTIELYKRMLLEEHCYEWSMKRGQHYEIEKHRKIQLLFKKNR